MSKAAVSVLVFGIYVLATALTLIAAPNVLLRLLGFTPAQEPWIRVVGVVLIAMAVYYLAAARSNATAFFQWTTVGRPLVLVGMIVLAAFHLAEPRVILFGVIEAAGAVWTALALRADQRT